MAFNAQQTSRVRAIVLMVALVVVAAVALFVVTGGFAPAGTAGSQGSAATGEATGTEAAGDDASAADAMETVDAQYGTAAQSLLAQLEQDPSNPTALLNVANGYFDWGVAALNHATDDDDRAHATELLEQAIGYYDEYLADNAGAKSALVDRAICVFYTGDHASAIAALEDLTQNVDPGFAPAWANLGMFYENDGRTDDARQAYETAIEAAGDADAYGVRDYAQDRLDALNGTS
ncbi:tetratricopeptide repeat protein [Collinsella intestinalis]|uniref:tetratricopeptide repeat protein n=1 Tax=Collinsella intestinalis TaxID=147207 RepID=UPI00195DAFA1|nr:tetratricopeptide repeat protein [Collinsella intestinalis]